ncbi:phenoloxidase-activating factor 2-like isoform X2 [Drosophila kikkawai]|uniref:Phenoloxidase-activating factor 2-like isoform X2 n=1 Tax=Drosophila kikkawai TaxID=30033 RepID=A0ABM4GQ71_DROKI
MGKLLLLNFQCFLIATLVLFGAAFPVNNTEDDFDFDTMFLPPTTTQRVIHDVKGPDTSVCGVRRMTDPDSSINPSRETLFGANPWVVGIYSKDTGKYIAAGTLIRYDALLTSAQALADIPQDQLLVEAGNWDRLSEVESLPHLNRSVRSIDVNENLVALVHLDTPFYPTLPHIVPACLPRKSDAAYTEKSCQTVGWGQPKINGSASDRMWFKKYSVMSREDCDYYLGEDPNLGYGKFCATDADNMFSPRNIGGGLFCAENETVIAGIALSSGGWEPENEAVLFASVPHYLDWILDKLSPYNGAELQVEII